MIGFGLLGLACSSSGGGLLTDASSGGDTGVVAGAADASAATDIGDEPDSGETAVDGSTADAAIPVDVPAPNDAGPVVQPDTGPPAPQWGAHACVEPPSGVSKGYKVGDQLANLEMKDCEGNVVTPADFCGADGLWILAAHGWCPHCKKASQLAEGLLQSVTSEGADLAAVVVLVETASQQPPTAADCQAFRTQSGHDKVVTLYAPISTMGVLWEQNYTALSVFANAEQILTGKVHSDVEVTLRAQIDAAIAP